jgi:quercetin dioxygenase-like cupin family protein
MNEQVNRESFPVASEAERNRRVVRLSDVPLVPLMPGVVTRIVPGENLTLSVPEIDPNTESTVHSHPHEQMIVVLEGQFDAVVDGARYPLVAGEVIRIPGDVPHGGITGGSTCRILEIFSPARRDFEVKLAEARDEGVR